jgi:hypothetical protein
MLPDLKRSFNILFIIRLEVAGYVWLCMAMYIAGYVCAKEIVSHNI